MMAGENFTYRIRIPVHMSTSKTRMRRRYGGGLQNRYRRRNVKKMNGGFLPLLAPIIAAAIGAIPGIASVAIQAAHNK